MIMNFPTNVKYTKEHEWIRLEGDVAYVGITDYAQEQLGDIVFVDITTEGETLEKDEVYVSSNTACSKGKKSESVYQMTHDDKRSETTIRISLSPYTMPSEITEFLESFDKHYNELIKLSE